MSENWLLTPSGSDAFTCKVSSVLNREAKQFGKKHLFDGDEETCWNSDQGTPQFVVVEFKEGSRRVEEVRIKFQGGFVGVECYLQAAKEGSDFESISQFFPDDSNKLQSFPIDVETNFEATKFRILFGSSTDFFGRVTIYSLQLFGR